jgi:hypothetical protein
MSSDNRIIAISTKVINDDDDNECDTIIHGNNNNDTDNNNQSTNYYNAVCTRIISARISTGLCGLWIGGPVLGKCLGIGTTYVASQGKDGPLISLSMYNIKRNKYGYIMIPLLIILPTFYTIRGFVLKILCYNPHSPDNTNDTITYINGENHESFKKKRNHQMLLKYLKLQMIHLNMCYNIMIMTIKNKISIYILDAITIIIRIIQIILKNLREVRPYRIRTKKDNKIR